MQFRQKSRLLIPNTTQVPNVLLDKVMPLLPEAPLKVLLVIIRFTYGFQKHSERVGFGQLAERSGLGRREVIRAVKILGDLLNVKKGGPGRGANEYSLNLAISEARIAALKHRIKTRGSDHSDTSDHPDTSDHSGTPVVTTVTPFQTKSSKPNKTRVFHSPKHRRKPVHSAIDPEQLEAFDQFYETYPRHVAREAALQAWRKLNPDSALTLTILVAVERYKSEVQDREPTYIAHPASWLNGRRWEDEATGNRQSQAINTTSAKGDLTYAHG
jgi:hypothetical protein